MVEYLSCGNIMSDVVVQPTGEVSTRHMGGPAFFALSGMRLWTDDCALVTSTGADYLEDYGPWLDRHGLTHEYIRLECEHVTCHRLTYGTDGKSLPNPYYSLYGDEQLGYLKTHPRHIRAALNRSVKGIYMAQGADRVVWDKLAAIKKEFNIKIMWELEYFNSGRNKESVLEVLSTADAFSLNITEAEGLFGVRGDDEVIFELQKLSVPFTFYRVGKRGAWAVGPKEAYYLPAVDVSAYVDQTGCGNCSTGAAMVAFFSGRSLSEALVMANIAAGFNCMQYGVYPHYTDQTRVKALGLLQEYLPKVRQIN